MLSEKTQVVWLKRSHIQLTLDPVNSARNVHVKAQWTVKQLLITVILNIPGTYDLVKCGEVLTECEWTLFKGRGSFLWSWSSSESNTRYISQNTNVLCVFVWPWCCIVPASSYRSRGGYIKPLVCVLLPLSSVSVFLWRLSGDEADEWEETCRVTDSLGEQPSQDDGGGSSPPAADEEQQLHHSVTQSSQGAQGGTRMWDLINKMAAFWWITRQVWEEMQRRGFLLLQFTVLEPP